MSQAAIAHSLSGQASFASRRRSPPRPLLAIDTSRLRLRAKYGEDPPLLRVTILCKSGQAGVGWIEFNLRDGVDREVELAFFLDPSCRGQGLMREAARAALPPVLRLLGARLVRATLPADALAAERVVRSLGLVETSRRGAQRRFAKDLCALI